MKEELYIDFPTFHRRFEENAGNGICRAQMDASAGENLNLTMKIVPRVEAFTLMASPT